MWAETIFQNPSLHKCIDVSYLKGGKSEKAESCLECNNSSTQEYLWAVFDPTLKTWRNLGILDAYGTENEMASISSIPLRQIKRSQTAEHVAETIQAWN